MVLALYKLLIFCFVFQNCVGTEDASETDMVKMEEEFTEMKEQ